MSHDAHCPPCQLGRLDACPRRSLTALACAMKVCWSHDGPMVKSVPLQAKAMPASTMLLGAGKPEVWHVHAPVRGRGARLQLRVQLGRALQQAREQLQRGPDAVRKARLVKVPVGHERAEAVQARQRQRQVRRSLRARAPRVHCCST